MTAATNTDPHPRRPPARCPNCDCPPRERYRLRNGAPLLQCPRCRLAWWAWPEFEPAAFYDESYFQSADAQKGYDDYSALEPGVRRTARTRLVRVARLLQAGAGSPVAGGSDARPRSGAGWRLLELGCGTGCFLDEAARAGWIVEGVEVSRFAAARAAQRGLSVRCAPLEEYEPAPGAFDCVALWDVIEHLRDPFAALITAGRALRPGGVLALSTGDVTSLCARLTRQYWHLFNLPEHLFFFSPAALAGAFDRAGCRMRCTTREVNWSPLAYLLERIAKPLGLSRVRPPAAIGATLLPATLFDVLGCYGVRE